MNYQGEIGSVTLYNPPGRHEEEEKAAKGKVDFLFLFRRRKIRYVMQWCAFTAGLWRGKSKCQNTTILYCTTTTATDCSHSRAFDYKMSVWNTKTVCCRPYFSSWPLSQKKNSTALDDPPTLDTDTQHNEQNKSSDGCQQSTRACSSLRYQHSARSAIIHSTHTHTALSPVITLSHYSSCTYKHNLYHPRLRLKGMFKYFDSKWNKKKKENTQCTKKLITITDNPPSNPTSTMDWYGMWYVIIIQNNNSPGWRSS